MSPGLFRHRRALSWTAMAALAVTGCATPQLAFPREWASGHAHAVDTPLLTVELDQTLSDRAENVTLLKQAELPKPDERRLLGLNGGRGVLLPYRRFEPTGEPIILIHGLNGSPADFDSLLTRLDRDRRKQAYVFLYDDTGRYLDHSGRDLARAMQELHRRLPPPATSRFRIVAHSMGGIVARAALNALVEPQWQALAQLEAERPVLPLTVSMLGTSIDLLTLDTPWHGFATAPADLRGVLPIASSLWDMVSNSRLLASVNRVKLPPNFRLHLVEADNAAAGETPDSIRAFAELNDDELDWMMRSVVNGPQDAQGREGLRNQLAALESSASFESLTRGAKTEAKNIELQRRRFRSLLAGAVCSLPGNHTSILAHPAIADWLLDGRDVCPGL